MASSYADKLALFRARFACRTDVWSRRWTSKRTGRSGFAPACGNEWRPGFCAKPEKRCSACRNRAWLPLSDETVRWHLLGATPSGKPFALGGYPVLPGDDCRFAALQVSATALSRGSPDLREIQRIAASMGMPATTTSAVDGDGVVLWWFFSAPVTAVLARSLVSACLTAARRAGANVPFSAWDGIVPERSTVPVTGPGTPVPLPLQGEARRRGRGVFLDPATLAPRADPWVALSEAPVLDPPRVERIVRNAQGRVWPVGGVDRERLSMLNDEYRMMNERDKAIQHSAFGIQHSRIRVRGILSNRLRIPLAGLPPGVAAALEETAAFLSPVFEDADRTRRPVFGIPVIESHARIEQLPVDRNSSVRRKVADWTRDVSAEAMPGVVASVLAAQIADGTIVPADEEQRDAILRDALAFFRYAFGRIVPLPDDRYLYFCPDPRSRARGVSNAEAWAEYAIHGATHGTGVPVPGKPWNGRAHNPHKAENLDRIVRMVRANECLPNPCGSISFLGATNRGKHLELVVRLDENANARADVFVVTFEASSKKARILKIETSRLMPLAEAAKRVVPNRAADATPPAFRRSQPHSEAEVKQELAMVAANGLGEEPCLSLPRGCVDAARAALRRFGAELRVRDDREEGEALDVAFRGELRPEQKAAAEAMMRHDCGVLEAGTAFGKTVLAAWMVAARGWSALVIVNRVTLLRQWIARLAQFLGLRERDIGRIGGGRRRPTGRIDVAVLQSLLRQTGAELGAMRYGSVVADECHGVPAATFERVADRFRARFFLGLSATPVRR
ncbi:MAG: DEAD/DEAH box helicase family protein, partial [Kiritimatiellae bacterium]|nr:DEAD/DEAH box helicase family protein [Kiritimatiellia bacterium]